MELENPDNYFASLFLCGDSWTNTFVDDLSTDNLPFTVFTNTHIMFNSHRLSRAYGVEMFKLALYTLT